MVLHFLHDAIGLKDSRHLFIQSEVKPKPIVTRSHAFSRALRQPHVITSSFDWFNVLSVSYVIGQSNYFGFGFTTLKRKPLYKIDLIFTEKSFNKPRTNACLLINSYDIQLLPAAITRYCWAQTKGLPVSPHFLTSLIKLLLGEPRLKKRHFRPFSCTQK